MNVETFRVEIAKLELRPTDVVVLKVQHFLSAEERRHLIRSFEHLKPEISNKVMVLDGGMDVSVLQEAA